MVHEGDDVTGIGDRTGQAAAVAGQSGSSVVGQKRPMAEASDGRDSSRARYILYRERGTKNRGAGHLAPPRPPTPILSTLHAAATTFTLRTPYSVLSVLRTLISVLCTLHSALWALARGHGAVNASAFRASATE